MTVEIPAPASQCWPVDWSVCAQETLEELTPEQIAVAEAAAAQTLRMLTGYRMGGCPTTVRPCNRSCVPGSWLTAPDPGVYFAGVFGGGFGFSPYVGLNGQWMNACGCRGDGCSCVKVQEVRLPGIVGEVYSVVVDGITLPETSYRIDNGNMLVRTDGEAWPVCQDMNLDEGEGTFLVTYLDGNPIDGVGAMVAGLLAAEFAQACLGGNCALPSNVTNLVRAGVSQDFTEEMFPGGKTGQYTVDSFIRIWNPTETLPAGIYSPDAPRARRTTWRAS